MQSGNGSTGSVKEILTIILFFADSLMLIVWQPDSPPHFVPYATVLEVLKTSTQIIIAPGYRYHIVKMMVTNFHQPQSTLLLLVSAFVNGDWKTIYRYALSHNFRFLSYGDSSLLIP